MLMATCETPAGLDFTSAIKLLNAEIDHYPQGREHGHEFVGASSGDRRQRLGER